MKSDLNPSETLEELADKVVSAMNRLAITNFENSLAEMVDFHRFLIGAYRTTGEGGQPDSYAKLGDWRAFHEEWIGEYRRLFERAADHIESTSEFASSLAHVAYRLLPSDGRSASPDVIAGLLDLDSVMVHRLEAWVGRHQIYETSYEEGQFTQRHKLAASLEPAYDDVLGAVVGAWEHTLERVPQMYAWGAERIAPDEQWRRFVASWTFLSRHLRNTAYIFAVAVWNDDDIGARYYGEALMRWFDKLRFAVAQEHRFSKGFVISNIVGDEWSRAGPKARVFFQHPEFDEPSPSGTFGEVLRNNLEDVIFLVSGVMLAWFIEKRQDSDIVPRHVLRVLADDLSDEDGHHLKREVGFRSLMLSFIRAWTAGERFDEAHYGLWLDQSVRQIDSMSERHVVSGRVFRPSTRSGREGLRLPWVACLLAFVPDNGDESLVRSIGQMTEREEAFLNGDRTLRDLLFELRQAKDALTRENHDYLARGMLALRPEARVEDKIGSLKAVLDGVIEAIDAGRRERLAKRSISARKLNSIRDRIESDLTSGAGGVEVLSGFSIERVTAELLARRYRCGGIEKGYLTDPEMAQAPVNLTEHISGSIQSFVNHCVWMDFTSRPRQTTKVKSEAEYLEVIKSAAKEISHAGGQPILLIADWNDPPWMADWFGWRVERRIGVEVHRKEDIQSGRYMGTVFDIDVFRIGIEKRQSFLLPANLLKQVRYSVHNDGHILEATFTGGEGEQPGTIEFKFSLDTQWDGRKILAIDYSDSAAQTENV